jgi:NhaA family Na+:H+ antiporter
VAFGILPLFAFANAGVPLGEIGPRLILDPITLGITLGLAIGKPVGVFGTVWLLLRASGRPPPEGTDLPMLFGVAMLCGIGFTMSLFIGTLAFPTPEQAAALRLGVIDGSLASAAAGSAWLAWRLPRAPRASAPPPSA